MDEKTADEFVRKLRTPGSDKGGLWEGHWKDPLHIATTIWRSEAIRKLNRDPQLKDDLSIALVELYLTEELPEIHDFYGIFEVDPIGIWYYDGDGSVDDPVWRQRVIPWRYLKNIVMHQAS